MVFGKERRRQKKANLRNETAEKLCRTRTNGCNAELIQFALFKKTEHDGLNMKSYKQKMKSIKIMKYEKSITKRKQNCYKY